MSSRTRTLCHQGPILIYFAMGRTVVYVFFGRYLNSGFKLAGGFKLGCSLCFYYSSYYIEINI